MNLGAGGIIIKNNAVLLILRKNTSTFDKVWTNPGGKSELNEIPEQTAVRELREEIGIETRILRRIDDYAHMNNGKLEGIFTGYLVEILRGEPRIMMPDKIDKMDYFPLDNLPANLAPFTRRYLDILIEEKRQKTMIY